MAKTESQSGGRVVSPHYLASAAGQRVLDEGGNAVEAAVATAAALCAVYPHMTGLGGDCFWTIFTPDPGASQGSGSSSAGRAAGSVYCVDGSGAAGRAVTKENLASVGFKSVPVRGPWSCLTLPGAVSGWEKALELSAGWGDPLPLSRLLADAAGLAESGSPVSRGQAAAMMNYWPSLKKQPGFAGRFAPGGYPQARGELQKSPALAACLRHLASKGLSDFYQGDLAAELAEDLKEAGVPLGLKDLVTQEAKLVEPLCIDVSGARIFNCPPPSQGLASLMILGIMDRLDWSKNKGYDQIHAIVEATKRVFALRNAEAADYGHMRVEPSSLLKAEVLDTLAADIDRFRATPWDDGVPGGDTVWFGAVDAEGRAVSAIQSIYHEFGSGVVLPRSGIVWHNRALGFSLSDGHPNCMAPGKKPLHTLNPALALFDDGRVMPYGSMGGDGQPQTQAAVFSRYAWLGQELEAAIRAPRWLQGRSWGASTNSLKLERNFSDGVLVALQKAGHSIELVTELSDLMGHAGALVRHPDGRIEAAADPRGDGSS